MAGLVKCACCGSQVPAEQGPIEIAPDGLPIAASVREGLGLPLLDLRSAGTFRVMIDGVKVDRAVAFDRRSGTVWRFQTTGTGSLMIRDGECLVEQLTGTVTVEATPAA